LIAGILSSLAISASATEAQLSPFMATAGNASQPIGHYEFCLGHRAECAVKSKTEKRVQLTPSRWNTLVAVNQAVNTAVSPATDQEMFGKAEVWSYPTEKGDCEDFVLLKRRELISRGWPTGALLITVVRQSNGDGHAVLTVLTDRGDLVLDNLQAGIKVWNQTDYQFVKRQSEFNSGKWVSIEDARAATVGSLKQ
jgi:predicted transglutaminase-like cysteine proteinase